ncbi:FAD-dependent oxidoreductase [Arthrobacter sp.]|uniref:NAD(P)/FAD-dependent oxidoreductase n=1 Tax=Arthrobacter sp. TaxID=1667 RepID=UPI00289DD763|nr:FAD-dependent oxidoreductase [Arthrobacter sp.]
MGDASGATLIVGNCQAGVQLASTLRELGDTAPIVLVGEEPHLPYQRPALSKAFLKGEATAASLTFRTPEWFVQQGIELVSGEQIVDISRNNDGGTAVGAGGRVFRFARLALTTGAAPRKLALPGAELQGVTYLRDADQAAALHRSLGQARSLVVIGGGFIGLEVATAGRAAGKQVTILEAAPRLVGRAVAETTSDFYLQAHRRRGTTVLLNAGIVRITGENGRVTGVELADGTTVPADVVVIGVGVLPRTELAERLGLEVSNGVVVDAGAVASDGVTVAAGDCANMPNPFAADYGNGNLRLESVQNAVEQAKTAARSLLGMEAEYRTVPWFWSDQGDLKLQIAGLSAGHDETILRGEPDGEKFSVLYYRSGRIIAADCINTPRDFMAVRNALSKGLDIPPEDARDLGRALKESAVPRVPA